MCKHESGFEHGELYIKFCHKCLETEAEVKLKKRVVKLESENKQLKEQIKELHAQLVPEVYCATCFTQDIIKDLREGKINDF